MPYERKGDRLRDLYELHRGLIRIQEMSTDRAEIRAARLQAEDVLDEIEEEKDRLRRQRQAERAPPKPRQSTRPTQAGRTKPRQPSPPRPEAEAIEPEDLDRLHQMHDLLLRKLAVAADPAEQADLTSDLLMIVQDIRQAEAQQQSARDRHQR